MFESCLATDNKNQSNFARVRIVSRSAAVGDVQEYFSVGVPLDTLQHRQQTAADLGEKGKATSSAVRENMT